MQHLIQELQYLVQSRLTLTNMPEVAAHGQVPNDVQSGTKVMQLAIDLPQTFGTRVNIHLTILTKSIMVFLATSDATMGGGSAALGSFVYAMPDVSMLLQTILRPS